jgi:hypothetical protein
MKEIILTQDKVALVDDEDFERVSAIRWHAHKSGRRQKKIYAEAFRKGTLRMHRFILGLPQFGKEQVVDHLDGNGLNNQKSNLRIVTQKENMQNAPGWVRKKEECCI